MKISVLKRPSKYLRDFKEKEWRQYNIKHYGGNGDWISGKFSLAAREGKEIVGLLNFQYDGGVIYLKNIIITKSQQGKGIGTKLMQKLEEMARKLGCHKIFLHTGAGWESAKFYEKLGYVKTSDLPNHYMHKDFLEYTKFIV